MISKCNPILRRLKIKVFSDHDLAEARLPNLLEKIVCNFIHESEFGEILMNAKNLKPLIILHGSKLSAKTIEQNEHLLKNLEELRIYEFGQKAEASNILLAKHPKLRSYIKSTPFSLW